MCRELSNEIQRGPGGHMWDFTTATSRPALGGTQCGHNSQHSRICLCSAASTPDLLPSILLKSFLFPPAGKTLNLPFLSCLGMLSLCHQVNRLEKPPAPLQSVFLLNGQIISLGPLGADSPVQMLHIKDYFIWREHTLLAQV